MADNTTTRDATELAQTLGTHVADSIPRDAQSIVLVIVDGHAGIGTTLTHPELMAVLRSIIEENDK